MLDHNRLKQSYSYELLCLLQLSQALYLSYEGLKRSSFYNVSIIYISYLLYLSYEGLQLMAFTTFLLFESQLYLTYEGLKQYPRNIRVKSMLMLYLYHHRITLTSQFFCNEMPIVCLRCLEIFYMSWRSIIGILYVEK